LSPNNTTEPQTRTILPKDGVPGAMQQKDIVRQRTEGKTSAGLPAVEIYFQKEQY
jgi:hypothetical protein